MKKSKCLILLCIGALVLGGCNLNSGGSSSSSSASSSESSSTKEEGAPIYALIGDFKDASWVDSPSEGSSYYLDSSITTYWERTVITSSSNGERDNARLAIVDYGTYNIVAGYTALTSNSTGAFEDSGTNYIGLYWDSTYRVEIDFTNNSKSITITLVSGGPTEGGESGSSTESGESGSSTESGESGSSSGDNNPGSGDVYDSAYTIYGEFTGDNSWNSNPAETLEVYLPYNSNYPETKKWTRTLSTPAAPTTSDDWEQWGPWDPSFRITTTGDWDKISTVAGYTELDSTSTGVENWGNEDNNEIQLLYWEATYTITIDLTSDNGSILVTYDTSSGGTHYEDTDTGGDDNDEGNEEEEGYDSHYVLAGDFPDCSWYGDVDSDSIYYLGYDSKDSNTKYWEVTVTMDVLGWVPGLRVIHSEYDETYEWSDESGDHLGGDVWTTIAGYSALDLDHSTGIVGTDDDDNIKLISGATYKVVIDLRDSVPYLSLTWEENKSCDSMYMLYGSFTGTNNWYIAPADSSYLLPYDSNDTNSLYWRKTVTMATTDEYQWTPAFRIINYGDYDATIAGYSNFTISTDSSLTFATSGNDNNIEISGVSGVTLDLTIDLRTSGSYSIIINSHDDSFVECDGYDGDVGDQPSTGESVEVNIDSYYVLTGNFSEASWSVNPGYDSIYTLPYDSSLNESKYWTRTINTGSQPSDTTYPGFRINQYSANGNDWITVAGYDSFEIDSNSTGTNGYNIDGSGNYNFLLDSWNTDYDLTIDMRGSTWKILINYHNDTFTSGVNGLYDGSSSSSSTTYDALDIDENYIMGADISSIAEVEAAGGKFYDYDGTEVDCISYLASQGINYARIRLWCDPTDASGASYLGGGNDLTTDIAIAQRCVAAGMKICLDLHYSDFWAHHGQQYAPKEWSSMDATAKISAASTWTTTVLQAFKDANCEPSMVQVGNETNGNQICGLEGNSNDAKNFFKTCCSAVRSFNQNIDIVIHFSDDQSVSTYKTYWDSLISYDCDFDVLGLSYYPFWHENGQTTTSFKNTLSSLSSYYTNKKICIMEYSYAFTTVWENGNNTMNNDFWTTEEEYAGLSASVANQEKVIYDINSVAASVTNCMGSFYWEPAWLSVSGSAWASSASASYYQSNGKSTSGYSFDTCSWANQALFNYSGIAQDSLKIYNIMWGDKN